MHIINFRTNGDTSNIERVYLYKDSGATAGTEGDPITGLTHNSTGLSISSIANNEASATAETVAGTDDIEDISTLGTYAAPTAGKVRFKEVDATAHPGLYEIQFADARYAVTDAKYLDICITGATDLATFQGRIYLDAVNEAGIRSALGLAAANLDTQLSTIDGVVDGIAADYATVSETNAIQATLSDAVTGVTPLTADIIEINGITVVGEGTSGNKWRA